MTNINRRYSELIRIPTFEERFEYLRLGGIVGDSTFGFDRYLNQYFYNNPAWKKVRRYIIMRDNGCDLAVEGENIFDRIYVHHMNPISVNDISDHSTTILDPEFLVCCSFDTHQAIHYGTDSSKKKLPINRHPGDTCPWK